MAARLINNSLTISMVISLLLHLLVIFSFDLLPRPHTDVPKEKIVSSLDVRLAQLPPKIKQPRPSKKLLTSRAPAQHKIPQAPIQDKPVSAPQSTAQSMEKSPPSADGATGVVFPNAVATPWPVQNRVSNSIFHASSLQQDAARIAYQQAMEAQARQQSEQQGQHMVVQLQQLLAKLLDAEPDVTGKCALAGTDGVLANQLVCDSPALHEALSKDEKTVTEMLVALSGIGKMLNGFSAEMRTDRPEIILTYKEYIN